MYPELLHVAGGTLHTYGVLIAVGFLLGIVVASRQARRQGEDADAMLVLGFWVLIGGLAGARLLYFLTDLDFYVGQCRGAGVPRPVGQLLWDCSKALHLWEGGLTWYGGLLGAFAVAAWIIHRRRLPFFRTADLGFPGVALGHFFGRLGCLAAGCCYGKPTGSPLGLQFGPKSLVFQDLADQLGAGTLVTPPLHATQLYEAAGELAIFASLLWLRPRKRYDGQVAAVYLLLYATLRFLVEIFRGDPLRGHLTELATPGFNRLLGLSADTSSFLSVSQGISLVVGAGALFLLWWLPRRQARVSRGR